MVAEFISIVDRPKFDETMEAKLLAAGFVHQDAWEFDAECLWFGFDQNWDHPCLVLMRHGYGYFVNFGLHASGTNPRMNLGDSNSAEDIIAIRDALDKLW